MQRMSGHVGCPLLEWCVLGCGSFRMLRLGRCWPAPEAVLGRVWPSKITAKKHLQRRADVPKLHLALPQSRGPRPLRHAACPGLGADAPGGRYA